MTYAQAAQRLVTQFSKLGITVGTAESCTGGQIATAITDIPGSSAVLLGGFVTYTNEIKTALLSVDPTIFARDTEVSEACAKAMAEGARMRLGCDLAVSATGYAGPGGGTLQNPVGTVYLAVASSLGTTAHRLSASPNAGRRAVRDAATLCALELLLSEAERIAPLKNI